jgi:hypothetical protein
VRHVVGHRHPAACLLSGCLLAVGMLAGWGAIHGERVGQVISAGAGCGAWLRLMGVSLKMIPGFKSP